jgi:DNA-binding protein HU-beta
MNKADIIHKIAADASISKAQANRMFGSFAEAVMEALRKGDTVMISGFGTFMLTQKKERPGRNPQTGAVITLPAKTAVRFRAGRNLLGALNG